MTGKTCIVTGATSGIGKETALALARLGATVVAICRNPERGEALVREIRAETGNDKTELLVADLSSMQQVRDVADEFGRRFARLHVLINNAGATFPERRESVDGVEMTLAVNHLAPFLLTNLLLDRLKAAGAARIVNVNSDAHEHGKIDFSNLQLQRNYGGGVGMRAYKNAKLANLLTVYELARRVGNTRITVNAVHPGYVDTNIINFSGATGSWRLVKPFWGLAMRFILSPGQGAATPVFLASSPLVAGVSGKYFEKCRAVPSSPLSRDRNLQRRMWEVSEQLVQKTFLIAAVVCLTMAGGHRANAAEQRYEYRVEDASYGNIGTYDFVVDKDGAQMAIATQAHIRVTVLGITMYRQEADRIEHWANGKLIDFHGITTENGKPVQIDGHNESGRFIITSPSGESAAPETVRPISPWSVGIAGAGNVMFMPDTGLITNVSLKDDGETSITRDGVVDKVRHYEIETGDGREHYQVWMNPEGTPLKFNIKDEQGNDTFTLIP